MKVLKYWGSRVHSISNSVPVGNQIDEVESLTAARQSGGNANEPGDAMRVVNALLTQVEACVLV